MGCPAAEVATSSVVIQARPQVNYDPAQAHQRLMAGTTTHYYDTALASSIGSCNKFAAIVVAEEMVVNRRNTREQSSRVSCAHPRGMNLESRWGLHLPNQGAYTLRSRAAKVPTTHRHGMLQACA